MFESQPFARRDALERRYDGPIPPADPARIPVPARARHRLLDRLAAETVAEAARRRCRLTGGEALADRRLAALGRSLKTYRHQAAAWR